MSDGNRWAGKAAAFLLVVATAAVTAVQLAPAAFAVDELFVSNYSANRITVLRLGRNVGIFERDKTTQQEVVQAITAGTPTKVSGIPATGATA